MSNELHIRKVEKNEYSRFVNFQKRLYKDDKNYRDLQSLSLNALLDKKTKIIKNSICEPFFVIRENKVVGVFSLVIMDRMNDTVQISFLDFYDDENIFKSIYEFAKEFAINHNAKKILIGLNIHVNYGLGLLSSGFDEMQGFGVAYNKPYYISHIEKFIKPSDILYSYRGKIEDLNFRPSQKIIDKLEKNFEIRKANFKDTKTLAKLYNKINNSSFVNHKYYYDTTIAEDEEFYREFGKILDDKNMLFAYHNDEIVGFLLWYPEFNQLIESGKGIDLFSFMKIKSNKKSIDTLRLVEFGVLPEFKNTGAIYALLHYLFKTEAKNFKYIESGWIMEDNKKSNGITNHVKMEKYKEFKVYEEILS